MRPIARATAGFLFVTALAIAAPGLAQTQMTADEFYETARGLAEDEAQLRSLFRLLGELPEEKEQILIDYAAEHLLVRAYTDRVYDALEVKPEIGGPLEDFFFGTMFATTEVITDGILRLTPEQQQQFLGYGRMSLVTLIDVQPELCAVQGPNLPMEELGRADIEVYRTMTVGEMRAMTDLYRQAIDAAIGGAPEPEPLTGAETAAAATAMQNAMIADPNTIALLTRVAGAPTIDDLDPADLCQLSIMAIDAAGQLAEPERSAAVRMLITGEF